MLTSATLTSATLRTSATWLAGRLRYYRRPIRDALIVVGVGRALWYFFVQGIQPWTFAGVDAHAYWGLDLAHLYDHSGVGDLSTYLYSPAFAQLMAPVGALPFAVFFGLWTAMNLALCVWLLRPWPWALPMLVLPITYELCVGNVHFLLAALIVASFDAPLAWAFPLLTKLTPGVGSLWFAARGEWRAFVLALGGTVAIVAVSYALAPGAWASWIALLTGSTGRTELLLPRVLLAAGIVVVGARSRRRWVVPVAAWLALPVIWVNSWVILLATIRLSREAPAPDLPARVGGEPQVSVG